MCSFTGFSIYNNNSENKQNSMNRALKKLKRQTQINVDYFAT